MSEVQQGEGCVWTPTHAPHHPSPPGASHSHRISAQAHLGPDEGAAAVHHALEPEANELVAVVPDVLAPAVSLVVLVHALVPVALVEHLGAVPLRAVSVPPALVPILALVDVHAVPLMMVAREGGKGGGRIMVMIIMMVSSRAAWHLALF